MGFVDYGHAQFSVGVAVYYKSSPSTTSEQGDGGVPRFKVLHEESVLGAAGESLELAMAQHFAEKFAKDTKSEPLSLSSRKGQRLVRRSCLP